MNKQTAVEWLVDELRNQIAQGTLDAIAISKLKMQAKAMEKEQIKYAYSQGVVDMVKDLNKVDAEKYYNETYK